MSAGSTVDCSVRTGRSARMEGSARTVSFVRIGHSVRTEGFVRMVHSVRTERSVRSVGTGDAVQIVREMVLAACWEERLHFACMFRI